MHYRHSYHAGNFADVLKHAVLCALLEALNRKPAPWCYVETHAGAGGYDLRGEGPAKTGEWREGIGALWDAAPPALATYLRAVHDFNGAGALVRYPGSPVFAAALARTADRIVLCERKPEVAVELRRRTAEDRRVKVHERDGYEAHALLPPKEKRGLVLVDPPFERPDEFEAVATLLERCLARFATGIYAAWYPLKSRFDAQRFERRVARAAGRPALAVHFDTGATGSGRMRACGMLVVNPPFGFDAQATAIGDALVQELGQSGRARCTVDALAGEPAARS